MLPLANLLLSINKMAATTGFTLNLEVVGVLLGILVSATVLLSLLISFTNRINALQIKVQYLQQELLEHSNLEGHKVLLDRLVHSIDNVNRVEKALDLHIQDYINKKDMTQYMLGQLDQKINHKFERLYGSMRDVEKFLQKSHSFRIREYLDDSDKIP